MNTISELVQSIGSSLIGASAVALSIIIFALQTNVKNMPYRLFLRFSKDKKLLIAYATLFFLTILLTVLSIFIGDIKEILSIIILGIVIFDIASIFFLVRFIYRRSLDLINPIQQLHILENDQKEMTNKWIEIISKDIEQFNLLDNKSFSVSDFNNRVALSMQKHKKLMENAIDDVLAVAKINAKRGDYSVTKKAFNVVVQMNVFHFRSKDELCSKYNNYDLMKVDKNNLLNYTQKIIQQYAEEAIADKSGKTEILLVLSAMAELMKIYSGVNYFEHKENEIMFANGQFQKIIELLEKNERFDIVFNALDFLGEALKSFSNAKCLFGVHWCYGPMLNVAKRAYENQHLEIIFSVFMQFSKIVVVLLRCEDQLDERQDINFSPAIVFVNNFIDEVADLLLNKNMAIWPVTYPLTSGDAYYSKDINNPNCFIGALHDIAERFTVYEDREKASSLERNLTLFAHSLTQRATFLPNAIRHPRSEFLTINLADEIIQWILRVIKILLVVCRSSAYDGRIKILKKGINTLIVVLEGMPNNQDTNFKGLNECTRNLLFDAIYHSKLLINKDITERLVAIFINWALRDRMLADSEEWFIGLAALSAIDVLSSQSLGLIPLQNSSLFVKNKSELLKKINNKSLEIEKSPYFVNYQISLEQLNQHLLKIINFS